MDNNYSTLVLFKALVLRNTGASVNPSFYKTLHTETIKRGFIFSPEVLNSYAYEDLRLLIDDIEKCLGLTAKKMNNAFHKSWNKVATAPEYQLYLEQLVHYITTYGFEGADIYHPETVYIPAENLKIPSLKADKVYLTVIKGYTPAELLDKLTAMLSAGIALKEDTLKHVRSLLQEILAEIQHTDTIDNLFKKIKNKEVKMFLYHQLQFLPENPIEFLRYIIYVATGKTLIIKNREFIELLKKDSNAVEMPRGVTIVDLFKKYDLLFGYKKLASIFYRFRLLFLALRHRNSSMRYIVNRLRKLAPANHVPMKEDYLNNITAAISKGSFSNGKLKEELKKVNIYRKIRLAQAIQYRLQDTSAIVYRVRNGKSYATDLQPTNKTSLKIALDTILTAIANDISVRVKGKKIFLPQNVQYALPATEKQFIGYFPSGTCVKVPENIVAGIHWYNLKRRVDLDLSALSLSQGKIGWDARLRDGECNVLFSGDMTDAPLPQGAAELIYFNKKVNSAYLLNVNNFTYDCYDEEREDTDNNSSGKSSRNTVPFKLVVGSTSKLNKLPHNYLIDPNRVEAIIPMEMTQRQTVLGLIIATEKERALYLTEVNIGKSRSISLDNSYVSQTLNYLLTQATNPIKLKDILIKAKAVLVDSPDDCDIDLSIEKIEKDTFIQLLSGV